MNQVFFLIFSLRLVFFLSYYFVFSLCSSEFSLYRQPRLVLLALFFLRVTFSIAIYLVWTGNLIRYL